MIDNAMSPTAQDRLKGSPGAPRAFVLTAGDPTNDPRIGWVAATLADKFDVTEIGLYRDLSTARAPDVEQIAPQLRRARAPATPWPAYIPDLNDVVLGDNAGWNALAGFAYETASTDPVLGYGRKTGRPLRAIHERHEQLRRILRTNASLIRAARALGPAELIVAADLESLAAGVTLKSDFGARLIYDAHEFWPYSFPQFTSPDEERAWTRIERRLASEADARFVVSPGLAEAMAKEYGVPFQTLPNAVPLAEAKSKPRTRVSSDDRIEFLFLGGFAPGRGIQLLIDAWARTPERCVLVLQGPDSAYRREMIAAAKATGHFGSRILFPTPVPETDLIGRAAQADVGLIPYEPTLINHVHCSPNKLSQYMAAGLPILANTTFFVEQTVRQADCGVVVDFKDIAAIAAAVQRLADDEAERRRLGANARKGFEAFFNWDAYAPALVAATGNPQRSGMPSPSDATAALRAEFQAQAPYRAPGAQNAVGRFGHSALRLGLKAAWHGVPFLRLIMLNNPRFRRRAEELREL